jgi:hypothetical protein
MQLSLLALWLVCASARRTSQASQSNIEAHVDEDVAEKDASIHYEFCKDGISTADVDFDSALPVEVIFAQAPLFSTIPAVGKKLGLLHLYHTSIFLAQGADGSRPKYWTLEFNSVIPNLLDTIVPEITKNASNAAGHSLTWDSDARFCLERGLKWGQEHWSKRFEVAAVVSVDQVTRAFTDFLLPTNNTAHGEHPQYQLIRVHNDGIFGWGDEEFVPDVTCTQGVNWFLHHLVTQQGATFQEGFRVQGTTTILMANKVKAIDTEDPKEMAAMISFYEHLNEHLSATTAKSKSMLDKFMALIEIGFWERKYVYDANQKVYYEVFGNHFPWIEIQYVELPLAGPIWMEQKPEVQPSMPSIDNRDWAMEISV